jgi:hypothetical protein
MLGLVGLANMNSYCNRIHKSEEDAQASLRSSLTDDADDSDAPPSSIYHILLSLYLQPPPQREPLLQPAIDLLSKHGSRLPDISAMDLIPDDLPVRSVESYFHGRIRAVNSLVNQTRIMASLRKAEGVITLGELYLGDGASNKQGGRHRHVVVTEESHCVVCHKKLAGGARGGSSVFAVLPDNAAVHYGCLNKVPGQKPVNVRAASNWGRGF